MNTSHVHSVNLPQAPLCTDAEGFLLETKLWTPTVAQRLALLAEVGELTDSHWAAINYLRERHQRSGAIPTARQLCKASGVHHAQLKVMFGGCLNVWRIAALPDPGEEARAYMN